MHEGNRDLYYDIHKEMKTTSKMCAQISHISWFVFWNFDFRLNLNEMASVFGERVSFAMCQATSNNRRNISNGRCELKLIDFDKISIRKYVCYLTHSIHPVQTKHNIDPLCVCFVCEERRTFYCFDFCAWIGRIYLCMYAAIHRLFIVTIVWLHLNSCVAVFFPLRFGKIINLDSLSSSMIRVLCNV